MLWPRVPLLYFPLFVLATSSMAEVLHAGLDIAESLQPTAPEDGSRSPSPASASDRSLSPSTGEWPWDVIKSILARPDEVVSTARKAENIYMQLRRDHDPHTPAYFLDEKHRWRRVIRRIIRKATRKSGTLFDYIQTVAAGVSRYYQ